MRDIPIISTLGVLAICVAAEAAPVRFNRDVRPILADRCLHCHGADEHGRQAELRLDREDGEQGAYRVRDDVRVVFPGRPDESELWRRITSDDDDVMPPPESHEERLTPAELAVIRQWIEQGAQYEPFWSFTPPVRAEPPAATDWSDAPIDRYVAARLKAESLRPSREADKRTLLRRVTFDLTGLPPTLEELASFEADNSADAYEQRVDALLASPRYGEHMARYWADLVRLADTSGLHTDRPRDFSPYRSWVIRAFNDNLPYDQFVRDQLAGDLYDDPTVDQLVASGFNRLNLMFERGSVLPEESLHRNALDRVEAFGTAFLGLTVQCAQCHDHKYDPISQREFYELYAFFDNCSADPQIGPAEPGGIQEPSVEVPVPSQRESMLAIDARLDELRAELVSLRKPGPPPRTEAPTVQFWRFDEARGTTAGNEIRTGRVATLAGSPKWIAPGVGSSAALELDSRASEYVDGGEINLSSTASGGQVTVSMWLRPDGFEGDNRILAQLTGGGSQEGSVRALTNGSLEVWNGAKWLRIAPPGALSIGFWQHLGLVWKGRSVTAYVDGVAQGTADAGFHFGEGNGRFGIGARFGRVHGATFHGGIDEVAVLDVAMSRDEIARLAGERGDAVDGLRGEMARRERERKQLLGPVRRAMVMREGAPPRRTHILVRGAYDNPGEEVQRDTPDFLPPLRASGDRPGRMDLANWLTSRQHPLTARVAVNRFWQQFFGVGLVKTSEDLGTRGEWPVHPELLDHLAVRFVESGWDVKGLVREIVLSATYRQSSDAPRDAYLADPENRLLARGSRFRMDAEMYRDQLLAASGRLNPEMYGRSVKPPQPPGLWKSVTMTNEFFEQDTGPAIVRRSLYTYWKRVMPPPQMTIMDAPSREFCVARRERTNTPLQALLLMNESEYFGFARSCAERTLREVDGDDDDVLRRLHERITSHRPTPTELTVLQEARKDFEQFYGARPELARQIAPDSPAPAQIAGWTMVAHSLFQLERVKVRR